MTTARAILDEPALISGRCAGCGIVGPLPVGYIADPQDIWVHSEDCWDEHFRAVFGSLFEEEPEEGPDNLANKALVPNPNPPKDAEPLRDRISQARPQSPQRRRQSVANDRAKPEWIT